MSHLGPLKKKKKNTETQSYHIMIVKMSKNTYFITGIDFFTKKKKKIRAHFSSVPIQFVTLCNEMGQTFKITYNTRPLTYVTP